MLSKDNVEKIARVLINTKRWEVMLRAVGDDYGAMRSRNMISGIFRVFGCLDLGLMFSFAINDILLEFETKFISIFDKLFRNCSVTFYVKSKGRKKYERKNCID